jgi:PrcB C-terminal
MCGFSMIPLLVALLVAQAQTSPVATVAQGPASAIEDPREAIVRSQTELAALWKSHAGPQSAPSVDFSANVVAAVFLGTRPTGGFRVDILGTRREGQALVIDYAERAPGREDIVPQVLTTPFHIVALPRYEGTIRFRKTTDGGRKP